MNQKPQTTAPGLTEELGVFTVRYWEAFSNRQCLLQADRWTHRHRHPSGSGRQGVLGLHTSHSLVLTHFYKIARLNLGLSLSSLGTH